MFKNICKSPNNWGRDYQWEGEFECFSLLLVEHSIQAPLIKGLKYGLDRWVEDMIEKLCYH